MYTGCNVVVCIGVLITVPIYAWCCDLFVIVASIVTVKFYASLLRFLSISLLQ